MSDGQYLLHVNPGEEATEEEIKEWRFNVQKWKQEVSSYLWAIANTKFNDLLNHELTEFYGAHKSVWPELDMLRTRLRNLKEIIEKPDIYLAGME